MTCEFCNQSRMDVQTWQIPSVIKYNACIPCARNIDNLVIEASNNLKEDIEIMLRNALTKVEKK